MISTTTQNNFFPEYLAYTIKSQKELEQAIAKHSNLSSAYVWTAVTHSDVREWYEQEWPKVRKYLDKNFLRIFQTVADEYIPRSWEFHLASVFLHHGLKMKEKTWEEGPVLDPIHQTPVLYKEMVAFPDWRANCIGDILSAECMRV